MKNIGDSFSFVFKDPNWLSKLLIGAVFTFLSIFLIGIPVIYGYGISLIQRVRKGEQNPLPEWKDVGVLFILGLKYIVTLLIYYIPIVIFMLPIFILLIFSFVKSVTLMAFVQGSIIISISIFFIILYALFIMLITPLISVQFAERESISDGLQIGKVFDRFKYYWKDVLIIFVLCFMLELFASIGLIFFLIGIFFTSFYVTVVRFHLYGQIGHNIQENLLL